MSPTAWQTIINFIEYWNINIINTIFFTLNTFVIIGATLIHFTNFKLPERAKEFFLFGKYALYSSRKSILTVPKSWISYTYLMGSILSLCYIYLVIEMYIFQSKLPKFVAILLNILAGGKNRKVILHSTECLIVTVLMGLQCARRAYETIFIQIFSKNSRLDMKHYLLSFYIYFVLMPVLVANAEGFVEGKFKHIFYWTFKFIVFIFIFLKRFNYQSHRFPGIVINSILLHSRFPFLLVATVSNEFNINLSTKRENIWKIDHRKTFASQRWLFRKGIITTYAFWNWHICFTTSWLFSRKYYMVASCNFRNK